MTPENVVRVLDHYDLGELHNCWRVERGYVNEKWFLETASGRYLLKRRHPGLKAPHLIGAQHALVQHLCRVGFPAPTIIPTRRSTTFLELDNESYEIQDYVPGDPCDVGKPVHLSEAARTLGRYHNAVAGFDHPTLHRPQERYGPAALAHIVKRLAKNWRGQTSSQVNLLVEELEEHAQDLATRFGEFGPLPRLVIHGVMHHGFYDGGDRKCFSIKSTISSISSRPKTGTLKSI